MAFGPEQRKALVAFLKRLDLVNLTQEMRREQEQLIAFYDRKPGRQPGFSPGKNKKKE
jgi:hypothetical protein